MSSTTNFHCECVFAAPPFNTRKDHFHCGCTHVVFVGDKYYRATSGELFCEECGSDGTKNSSLRCVCPCGKRVFKWSSMAIDPQTQTKLCWKCGVPRIAEARRKNATKRKERQRQYRLQWQTAVDCEEEKSAS